MTLHATETERGGRPRAGSNALATSNPVREDGRMARILVTEQLAERGLAVMREAGHDVDEQLGPTPDELIELVKGAHALIIRSATQVTAEVIEAGKELVVIGRAGIGLDNVDRDA